ncbi:hypothetical protein [Streptomyces sp. NPDC058847]|uniref:hypothetical protein n=1 Tax=Streptomyces sp. NPDC058847 TaxID=3346649 RepID=UPI0036C4778B
MFHETRQSLEKDGYRAQLAHWADGWLLLRSRQGTDMAAAFSEIREAHLDVALAKPQLVLEVGVDVARDGAGRWRYAARWHRARLDLSPDVVTVRSVTPLSTRPGMSMSVSDVPLWPQRRGRAPGRGGESLYAADRVQAALATRPGKGRHGAAPSEGGRLSTPVD